MTDYEPYVADPAEPAAEPRFARLRGPVGTAAIIIVVIAVVVLALLGQDDEDPSLNVPLDQFAPPADTAPAPEAPAPEAAAP